MSKKCFNHFPEKGVTFSKVHLEKFDVTVVIESRITRNTSKLSVISLRDDTVVSTPTNASMDISYFNKNYLYGLLRSQQ